MGVLDWLGIAYVVQAVALAITLYGMNHRIKKLEKQKGG